MTPDPPGTPAPSPSPLSTLALGIGGFLVGVGLLLLGGDRSNRSAAFVTSSGFAVWASIIGVQTAFWVTAAGPLWHDLIRVWRRSTADRGALAVLAGALVVILVVFPFFSAAATIPWPLWGHQPKVRVLALTAVSPSAYPPCRASR
jgi:hypothetical protein